MKYIKTYEKLNKLQIGDYILVKTYDNRINNEIMIIKGEGMSSHSVKAELPDVMDNYLIYYDEIIKKLSQEEVDFYKNIKKYNI